MPTDKPRFMLTLPEDVYRWFHEQELAEGVSKSALGNACIAAFRYLSKEERTTLLGWAGVVAKEGASWSEFEGVCDQHHRDRVKHLAKALAEAVQRAVEESARQRREQESGADQ